MNYLSIESFDSTVFAGVTVKLKKMSQRRRAEFNLNMAALLNKARNLDIANEPLDLEYGTFLKALEAAQAASPETLPVFPEDKLDAVGKAWAEKRRFEQDDMAPALLRWGVASIEGLVIDGKPADVELLIDAGPPELCEEIAYQVTRVMNMSAAERKNSESPTTSGAVADGATTNTTAPPAGIATSTSSATATGTSPS